MGKNMDCLIVRQPYASLIAFGFKRWEFRSYDTKKTGEIGIAASKAQPFETKNLELNRISHLLPRGVVLATAELVTSFFAASNDLKQFISEPVTANINGYSIKTLGEPIGEPVEDVTAAASNPRWQSFSWLLGNVKPLKTPIPFEQTSQSTWVSVNM